MIEHVQVPELSAHAVESPANRLNNFGGKAGPGRRKGSRTVVEPTQARVWRLLGKTYERMLIRGGEPVIDKKTGKPKRDGKGRLVRKTLPPALLKQAADWAEATQKMQGSGKVDRDGRLKGPETLADRAKEALGKRAQTEEKAE